LEKPFVTPPNLKIQVVNYILRMQDLGFGLTVNQVRRVTYNKVVEAAGINHTFNRESQMAGWYWWDKLRERYNFVTEDTTESSHPLSFDGEPNFAR
jgi:hypothetical protein